MSLVKNWPVQIGKKKLLKRTKIVCEIDGSKAHDNKLTSFLGWIRDLVKEVSTWCPPKENQSRRSGGIYPPERRLMR